MSVSYAILTRKCSTMQHGNSSFFSQNGFPPHRQMMLPLRACAYHYEHALSSSGNNENVTYTRAVPNCIPSSGVHLSSPIRLFTGFTGWIRWDLETIFFSNKRNNRFDAQTDISQRDKILFFLWPLVVF